MNNHGVDHNYINKLLCISYYQLTIISLLNFNKVPSPSSITLVSSDRSSRPNSLPILGSDVTLTCTLKLNSAVVASEILLLMVNVQLLRDGIPLALTGPTIRDTTFTYTRRLESFGRSDSGNYTCMASVGPDPALTYVTGNETLSTAVNIKAGILVRHCLGGFYVIRRPKGSM